MNGLILTNTGTASSNGKTGVLSVNVLSSQTETIDLYKSDFPAIKWLVSFYDSVLNKARSFEINAVNDFQGTIDWSVSAVVGENFDAIINLTQGPNPDETVFSVQNVSLNTIEVKAKRL